MIARPFFMKTTVERERYVVFVKKGNAQNITIIIGFIHLFFLYCWVVMNVQKKTSVQPSLFRKVWYFFPLQLFFLHLKRNQVVLGLWGILFLYVGRALGNKYGIPFLFLSPEYLGSIDFVSFVILGVAVGGFITAFNIYSYILFASEFSFLATFNRPFIKFCYNNIIVPVGFVLFFLFASYRFQVQEELFAPFQAILNLVGFSLGIILFIIASSIYFIRFNKNIYKISGKDEAYFNRKIKKGTKESTLHKKTKWFSRLNKRKKIRVVTYLHTPFEVKLARNIKHYDKKLLRRVFYQNHINASVFEFLLFLSFVALGIFRENPVFNIPAGASIIMFFTLLLLFYSALYSWLKKWTISAILLLLVILNYSTNSAESYLFKSYAYGLDYIHKPKYANRRLLELTQDETTISSSREKAVLRLNNWKERQGSEKPKLTIISVSGGGLRSALWSFYVTSYLDSVCHHTLLKSTHLITGASGGMIGMSYLRELYLQQQTADTAIRLTNPVYLSNISKDLLNPLLFGIATTDFIYKISKFEYKGFSYPKDRGYSFERKLNQNLSSVFTDKSLDDYRTAETKGIIPSMVLTPTIANDGRRLLISPHSLSFLSAKDKKTFNNIDYQQFFKANHPENLRFLSALRMSANFPYILPLVSLPSVPNMEMIDAGVKDNYGVQTASLFLDEFKDWIKENTSGVVFIEIRDTPKLKAIDKNNNYNSFFKRLFFPLGNLIVNVLRTQDYNNTQLFDQLKNAYPVKIDNFVLFVNSENKNNVSMSWHLTHLDKTKIFSSIHSKHNQHEIKNIKEILAKP